MTLTNICTWMKVCFVLNYEVLRLSIRFCNKKKVWQSYFFKMNNFPTKTKEIYVTSVDSIGACSPLVEMSTPFYMYDRL